MPLNTFEIVSDAVASIQASGYEHVFDIQIDETENFIANGLISHNTRWHEDDLAGRILASEDGPSWEVVNLPAEAEEGDPLGRAVGEALNPDRYDLPALAQIKRVLGTYAYASLYQQRPMPAEGGTFKLSWFTNRIRREDMPANCKRVRYWDKAGSDDDGDYTVGALMAFHQPTGMAYLEDIVRGQWSSGRRETIMKQTAQRDYDRYGRGVTIWIEQEPAASGKDSAQTSIQNLAGFTARKHRPSGDKEVRADPLSAAFENGLAMLVVGEWNIPFIDEAIVFPNGTHDDQVDAAAGGFNRITTRKRAQGVSPVGAVGFSKWN